MIQHVYCTCQTGAEKALKREVEFRTPGWRFAFSRPGFVTFKLDEPVELRRFEPPRLIFARALVGSICKLSGQESLGEAAASVWSMPGVGELADAESPLRLHVWQRDAGVPGERGFEPGPTPLSSAAREALVAAAPEGGLHQPNSPGPNSSGPNSSGPGKRPAAVLDVVLVEPNEWWVGCHLMHTRPDRWPGGVPPVRLPEHAVSRAYLKMREAIAWGHLPAAKGDEWIELGCAPGGASQALLDEGMRVVGVDPAEVDPAVAGHERFRHLRCRATEAKRKEFTSARWLAADINAAPSYTLDAVESVVTHPSAKVRGLALTLKLPDWDLASPESLLEFFERIRGWGYRHVRARQLAFNRQELCVIAVRSRGQRRVRR